MSIKIEVQENENIESALRRFRRKSRCEYGKRWTKKRYGYYEKPSQLKRKRKKMASLWLTRVGLYAGRDNRCSLHLYIGLKELFDRTGANNAAGK